MQAYTTDEQTIKHLDSLETEKRNLNSIGITSFSTLEILQCINNEDQTVALRVAQAFPAIEKAVELITARMKNKGRLVYVGAGTSGRLGYMDAAECRPTYGTKEDAIACVMAGGHKAVFTAQEMLEDEWEMAQEDLEKWGLQPEDVVLAASASGRTPYCISALDYANSIGAGTVALACNLHSEMANHAQVGIEVNTGAEVIMGSTRMKAGTAQKMVMNLISTTVMIKLGRTYDNLMVMITARNTKANHRLVRLFTTISDNPDETYAQQMLEAASGNLSIALLMSAFQIEQGAAKELLEKHNGHFANALGALK